MSKKKKKSVHIATLQDIVDTATPQNVDLLMRDLALWIHTCVIMKTAGLGMSDVAMEWTDDGKNEITGYTIKFDTKP